MRALSNSRILIVDDHQIVRAGLIGALERAGSVNLSQASSAKEGLAHISTSNFDLVIADQNLQDGTGVNCLQFARTLTPNAILVLFTIDESWPLVEAAKKSGVNLFLSKSAPLELIIDSIKVALTKVERFSYIAPCLPQRRIELPRLTATELEVLTMLADGLTSIEIANRRSNSQATIKSHINAIYRKLRARNRVEAVRSALAEGLI